MAITDKGMQAAPGTADRWLNESFGKGHGALLGRITPSGARSFYFRYTGSTGQVRMSIGPFHPKGDGERSFTTSQARDRAKHLSMLYRSGHTDLREHLAQEAADRLAAAEAERQRLAAEAEAAELERRRRVTVRVLFDRWADIELKPHLRADGKRAGRKDAGKYAREQFERHVFPVIGEMTAKNVRKSDLLAILDAQKAAGKLRTANVLLADLKQMFRFALARDLVERNPLDVVTKRDIGGASVERDRALSEEEIRLLAPATAGAGLSPRSGIAIWLILATGVRIGELSGAVWADTLPADPMARKAKVEELTAAADKEEVKFGVIDAKARTWYLPDTKNQRDHTIHLSAFALKQVEQLAALRESLKDGCGNELSPWVFPATDNRRPLGPKTLGKQLSDRQRPAEKRLANRTKHTEALMLPGGRWTPHDLRRTAATQMARLGFSTDVINECLNHVTTDRMARVYIKDRRLADQARAFDALGAHLGAMTTGAATPTGAQIIPLPLAA